MLKSSDMIRIATFNIWNHESFWVERLEAICEEVRNISPHILALQEVRSCVTYESKKNVAQYIADQTGYPFCIFKEYPDSPDEGLAFLSKTPILAEEAIWETDIEESDYCAIRIMFKYKGYKFGITNIHLNWKSSRIRQEQMNTVNNWIKNSVSDYELLCGDFNDDPYSMVHQYLISKHWIDVAQFKEDQENMIAQPTLDYKKNPNLKGDVKQEKRYDWIMIQENDSFEIPTIEKVSILGDTSLTSFGVFPSDHYGVFADLKFDK
ncbi:endonuclease/exonuclease/phosphatase family protein [Bacillus cereus group sp. BfR-BA-01383]|uniref:endonuclease/exonuclease/phosphatase family protein n=1 Tax=Bacillus cereus group sp. BfR-BA-01383 TaxID=2920327 RepID=UPI001F57005A|nr:endonuclease/exonuclease/phosphatase family protein [Bacillus cereus group sp. BfR-BA-01383]